MKVKDVRDVVRASGREKAAAVLNSFPVRELGRETPSSDLLRNAERFASSVGNVGHVEWRGVSLYKPCGTLGGDGASLIHLVTNGAMVPLVRASFNGPDALQCLSAMQWREQLAKAPASSLRGGCLAVNPFAADGVAVLHHRLILLKGSGPLPLQSRMLWRLRELGLSIGCVIHDGAESLHSLVVISAGSLVEYKDTARRMFAILGKLGFDRSSVSPESLIVLPGLKHGKSAPSLWFMDDRTEATSEAVFVTIEDAVNVVVSAVDVETPESPSPANLFTVEAFDSPGNDVGNAALFVKRWGGVLRHAPQLKTWFTFDAGIWKRDTSRAVVEMGKVVSHELLQLAAALRGEAQKMGMVRALRMGEAGRLAKMIELAESDRALAVDVARLDANAYLIGVGNGVLDLTSGELLEEQTAKDALVTKRLGCDFKPDARCPLWERFIHDTTGGDTGLIRFLQQSVGYCLTGLMEEQVFWFLYGSGANGKSVFMETVHALAGDYATRADDSILVAAHNSRPGPSLARLPGVRFLLGRETAEGQRLNEGLVKDLTGGDTITAEAKYCAPFDFQPVAKLWMFGNHKPAIRGTDEGIWRRVRLVPFTITVPPDKRDGELCRRLRAELPGILNWAIKGLNDWAANGRKLAVPECVKAAGEEYRTDSDWLGDFVEERLEKLAGFTSSKREVYQAYAEWAKAEGLNHPLPNKTFSRRLKERGFSESNAKAWRDVRLVAE